MIVLAKKLARGCLFTARALVCFLGALVLPAIAQRDCLIKYKHVAVAVGVNGIITLALKLIDVTNLTLAGRFYFRAFNNGE